MTQIEIRHPEPAGPGRHRADTSVTTAGDNTVAQGRRRRLTSALAVTAAIGLAGILVVPGPAAARSTGSVADLRGDVNRDSVVDLTVGSDASDEAGEDAWTRVRGVILLPNLDDDSRRCRVRDRRGRPLPFKTIVNCNDAADGVVNGAKDAAGLCPSRRSSTATTPPTGWSTAPRTPPTSPGCAPCACRPSPPPRVAQSR